MLKEISFFCQHQEYFRQGYSGRYIIIKDENLIGDFDSWQQASLQGLALFKEDSFFIKYCASDNRLLTPAHD